MIYCFSDDDGNTIDREFSMADVPWSFEEDGKTWTRDLRAEKRGERQSGG